jgi:hypothetical protein
MIVYCGVFSLGVVGPKTAILEGQNIFLFSGFRQIQNVKQRFIFKSQANAGFSAVADNNAPSNTLRRFGVLRPNVQFD